MPSIVSPGLSNAKKTAPFAWAPECGCTFAYLTLKSFVTLSIAKFSDLSTNSHPP